VTADLAQITATPLPWPALEGRTVVVTGAAGLVASYLVEALLYRNEAGAGEPTRVVATVRNADRARERFAAYAGRDDLVVVVHDAAQPLAYAGRVDYLVHAAGQATPSAFGRDPIGTYLPNVMGTHHLLERAHRDGSAGVLFLSSGAVHGALHPDAPVLDETVYGVVDPLDPRASYAESKRMGETICRSWFTQHGIPVRMARIGHTYGPGMRRSDERAFAQFVFNALDGQDIVLNSDGSAVRPYSYLADTTTALLMLLLAGQDGEAYLVANPATRCTIRELAELVASLAPSGGVSVRRAGGALPADYLPNRDPAHPIDIAKIRALGWEPRIGLREGFLRTIESYG
jgi:dTDP-glucose 4,6-dehydratase